MDKGTDPAGPGSAPGQVTDAAGSPAPVPARDGEVRASASAPDGGPNGAGQGGGGAEPGVSGNSGRVHGRRGRGPFYAALDLGTNNCRLLIAEPAGEAFRVVDSFSRIVRLGEGVAQNGGSARRRWSARSARSRSAPQKLGDRPHGARPADRHRGVPRRRERRRVPRARARRGRARSRDRRPAHRGAARRRRLLFAARPRLPPAPCSSISAAAPRRSSGSTGAGTRRRGGLVRAWVSLPVGVVTLAERHGGVDVDGGGVRGDGRGRALASSTASTRAMR